MSVVNWLIKGLGAVLVLAGGTGAGWYLAAREKRRIDRLREWEQILLLLYGEIEYAGSDLPESIGVLKRHSHFFSLFFECIEEELRRSAGQTMEQIWSGAWQQFYGTMSTWQDGDVALIQELGGHLGRSDRKTQLQTLQLFRQRTQTVLQQAQEEYKNKSKIYRTLGVAAGVFLSVLFL